LTQKEARSFISTIFDANLTTSYFLAFEEDKIKSKATIAEIYTSELDVSSFIDEMLKATAGKKK